MLKKICRLFLGLVVCAGSACVTPTHVSSANTLDTEGVVITRVQAAGASGAKEEAIVLHNNSEFDFNISNWCVANKNGVSFACFRPSYPIDLIEDIYVQAYGDAVIVSQEYANANQSTQGNYSLVYTVTNQSSGSIINSSDTLTLLNADEQTVDMVSWSIAIPSGKILSRALRAANPDVYINTNSPSDWATINRLALPLNSIESRYTLIEPMPELDPILEVPVEPNIEPSPPIMPPFITEVFPNPAGADEGKEFIELYNPNAQSSITLDQYALLIGNDTLKPYYFPPAVIIPPLSYIVITNQDLGYTLVNTGSKIQLAKDGASIGEVVQYVTAKDNDSWALIDGVWQYTTQPTPGKENGLAVVSEAKTPTALSTSTPKPCAANQFRNPQTGRCKLLSTNSALPAPCKENQERNSSTHRCRNIVVASAQVACKVGQERNPDTNRCRNIVKMSKAGSGVVTRTNSSAAMSWYYWVAIGGIILLLLAYAIWEWRHELVGAGLKIKAAFAKGKD